MPSPQSLRRLANLTKKVRDDMRSGGMAINFRYLFRSTSILARVVEILADHVATEAEEKQRLELAVALAQVEEAVVDEAVVDKDAAAEAGGEESAAGGEAARSRKRAGAES